VEQQVIIRQHVDPSAMGNVAHVLRVLRADTRLYVEVWQTLDATEPTLMQAVNAAIDRFNQRRTCHGPQEGNGII
jgi:hypothetical protein